MQAVKADLEFKYRYWIDFGASQERERIIALLKRNIGWMEALEYDYWADELADLITGEDPGRDGEDE